jgi:hypothetical protein
VDLPAERKASSRATAEDFLRRLSEGDPDRTAELFAEHIDWQLNWPDSGHPAVPRIRPRSTRADLADHFREIAARTDAIVLGDIRQTAKTTGQPYTALCAQIEEGAALRADYVRLVWFAPLFSEWQIARVAERGGDEQEASNFSDKIRERIMELLVTP